MQLNTVIFDMDGLLIDSEPLWNEAADEVFQRFGMKLTPEQYGTSTGLRTKEFVEHWFTHFAIDEKYAAVTQKDIVELVINKVKTKGKPLPGVEHIFNFFIKRNFKIGLATSSPDELINVVVDFLGIRNYLRAISSADNLPYGKPHPQVYLNCAEQLNILPTQCICFEDSFNGLVAAKAARMKCVVVPANGQLNNNRWAAADLKMASLNNFNELLLQIL